MPRLFEQLKQSVAAWRQQGYACVEHPLIGEILTFQRQSAVDGAPLKFLREPQFLALEVYWYIRIQQKTPHIIDLYKHYYADDKAAFFEALDILMSKDAVGFATIENVIDKVMQDDAFVKEKKLQALREALTLDYPSYILALAMGAGKTVLIGTIIATEFAMSLRYPNGKTSFMKNALVFAPGTTIIDSLREIGELPFDKILPPNLSRDFLGNLKIEYPNKGREIQTQHGSSYNLIVTNTEKISLRIKPRKNQPSLNVERSKLQANLRLQKIASLPNLGVFSDEAHHTYGNTFEKIKRVRETINYIHQATPLIAVINTTGTPYHKKQTLKEVIVWYGLGEGISDNILKNLQDGIHQYHMADESEEAVFTDIVAAFFKRYGAVSLADGATSKIAFYFKTQQHLEESKLLIEQAMASIREDISQVLVNTQTSSAAEIEQFKRLNNPTNQKRVILLIGKGVEGWNCPSLFACALIKKQTSNNYVLQAATRCLRQVSGNQHSAKIFLDSVNARILEKELVNNFGTNFRKISMHAHDKKIVMVRIEKPELPKLEITRTIKRAVRLENSIKPIRLEKPRAQQPPAALRSILTPDFRGQRDILMPTGAAEKLQTVKKSIACHTAAWKISSRYHAPILSILKQLNHLYPKGSMPEKHLYGIFKQVEEQQANYTTIEEKITEALALIRVKDAHGREIFERGEDGAFVHRLRLLKSTFERMKNHDLLAEKSYYADRRDLSFHYTPYNFDSQPEQSLFQQVLTILDIGDDEVQTFLFTGGLTDPEKTDFHFQYLGEDNRYHRYFPDFVLVKKTGEFYIIEVKSENALGDVATEAKKKAVQWLQKIQPDKFKYTIVYARESTVGVREIQPIVAWIKNQSTGHTS